MDITVIVGSIGLILSFLVAPPQLIKIMRTKNVKGISKWTYIILCMVMLCYLIRSIAIVEWIFILSNGINILFNIWVLILIVKYEK